jgi:eukaryotic-like serine/threonine-protein kinase
MSDPGPRDREGLSPTIVGRIELICDRFESAWRGEARPRIEDYWKEADGPDLLRELLVLELAYCVRRHDYPTPADYRPRFAAHPEVIRAAFKTVPTRRPSPEPPAPASSRSSADRNLLFGVLAMQMDFVTREALIAAVSAWALDKSRPLDQILVEQGTLGADERDLLEPLIRKHLERHGDDPGRSLASVGSRGPAREALRHVADPELDASLAHLGDLDATAIAAAQPEASRFFAGHPGARRFHVLRPLAWGGLGEVFVARDEELHREVALKLIQERHASDPGSLTRFRFEAEITGRLEHPGVIPMYGLGVDERGRAYYAMRFVRGESLKESIARFHGEDGPTREAGQRSLAFRELLGRFVDVCNTMAYAHGRGILHRDLKPANVMLGPYGETLVVDWGLAKVAGCPDGEPFTPDASLELLRASAGASTEPGSWLGTPAYMSPEQAAGRIDQLGPASDVYSLGATLYNLLTGKTAFDGPDVFTLLGKIRAGDFPPPRSVDPRIDPAMDSVCLKAMALTPGDRYNSPRALAEDVKRWMADEPVSAWREPMPTRLARWSRRHRTWVAASVLSLVTAVTLLTAMVVAVRREQGRTDAALRMAEANYRDARGAVDDFLTSVSEEALLDAPGLQPVRRKLLESALAYHRRFIERRSGDPGAMVDLARSHAALAELTAQIRSNAEALSGYEQAIRLYQDLDARRPGDVPIRTGSARCYTCVADIQNQLARRREAHEACDRAIRLCEALVEEQPSDPRLRHNLAAAVYTKALIAHTSERTRESTALYERAAHLEEEVVARSAGASWARESLALYAFTMSRGLANTGRAAQAREACLQAIDQYEVLRRDLPRALGYRHKQALALDNLASLDARAARWADATRSGEQARALLADLTRDNPVVTGYRAALALANDHLGWYYMALPGYRDRAVAALRSAVDLYEGLARERDSEGLSVPDFAVCLQKLGSIELEDGRYAEAQSHFRRSCELSEQAARQRPENLVLLGALGSTYADLGKASRKLGRNDEAVGQYRKAIALLRSAFGGGTGHAGEHVTEWTCEMAQALCAAGRPDEAAESLDGLRAELRGEPTALYYIACGFSTCAADAGSRTDGAAPGRQAARRRYARLAVDTLRDAIRAGFRELKRLDDDPDLEPIRPLRDFQLLKLDAAFPENVFIRTE